MTVRFVAALGLVVACACTRPTPGPGDTTPTKLAQPSAPTAGPAAAPKPAGSAPSTAPGLAGAPVGIESFAPMPADAIASNDRGVESLAKGKVEDAVRSLSSALAIAPGFVLARYNLACARARARDFDGAAADLEKVYEADFIAIRAHAASDSDLVDFWKSAPGHALAARTADFEARYDAVLARGLRAILWHDGASARGILKPSLLRVGVFDTETSRFVPVAPPSSKAFAGFAATRVPFAVLATGAVRDFLGGDMDPGKSLEQILVYPISTKGEPTATIPAKLAPSVASLTLGAASAGLEACQATAPLDDDPDGDKYCATFELRYGEPLTKKLHSYAQTPARSAARLRERPVTIDVGYNHWGYVVTESDATYSYAPLELTLPSGAKIAIPKEATYYKASPRAIAPSPSGDRVVLVFNADVLVCDPSQDVPGRYKLTLVEPATGKVTLLGEGDGAGHATFRADGELFVQKGRRVYRVARDGAQTALPDGVLLVPPLDRMPECGF